MAGLTDQAGGMKVSGGEAIERAHQAWQESMARQLDVLRGEILATQPGRLAANCGGSLEDQHIRTTAVKACLKYGIFHRAAWAGNIAVNPRTSIHRKSLGLHLDHPHVGMI